MRQFMGINGDTFLYWNTERAKCSEIERMNERQKPEKTFPGRNRILSVNSSSAKPQRLSRSKAEEVANSLRYH